MRQRGFRGPVLYGPPVYGPPPMSLGPVFACRPKPFDLTMCEASFGKIREADDAELAQVSARSISS